MDGFAVTQSSSDFYPNFPDCFARYGLIRFQTSTFCNVLEIMPVIDDDGSDNEEGNNPAQTTEEESRKKNTNEKGFP